MVAEVVGRLRFLGVVWALAAFAAAWPVAAQEGSLLKEGEQLLGNSKQQAGEKPEEKASPRTPWPSPRAVMAAFLEASRAKHFTDAGEAFDLTWIAEDQDKTEAYKIAFEFTEVLYRTANVQAEDFPGESRLSAETRKESVWLGPPPGKEQPHIRIGFGRAPGGGWRIDEATARNVATWYDEYQGLEVLAAVISTLPFVDWLRFQIRERMPEALLETTFLLENWQWLALLVAVFLAVAFDRLVRFALGLALERLAASKRVKLEPESLVSFERPAGLLAGALLFRWLMPLLVTRIDVYAALDLATSSVAVFATVWAAYRLVDVFCDYLAAAAKKTENRFDDVLVPLLRRTLKIFVVIIGVVYVGSLVTDNLWGVMAGLGLGSLALGLAAKDSVENLFGTFTVLMDKPFLLGDWIIVDKLEGTVEEVGFRSTRIRTFYNSLITVPNRTFINGTVDNMGARFYRRIRETLSLTYDTPPEKIEAFCEGVRELIRKHPYTRKDYYHVYFNAFGASSLDVLLYCFLKVPEWGTELRERHRLFADILRVAEALDVDFAFPTQTLHLAKDEDLEHPDRPSDDPEGARRGRSVADEVMARSLAPFGDERPPPVEY